MPAVYYAKAEPSPVGKKLIKVYHFEAHLYFFTAALPLFTYYEDRVPTYGESPLFT